MIKEGKARHTQISDWITSSIGKGVFKPDQKLPSENELAAQFDVSRVTVRRALQTLESDKVIYRCQGLGSFVSDNRTPQNLVNLTDFDEDMKRVGLRASSEIVAFEHQLAGARLAEHLSVKEGSPVVRVERLRLGDGEPIAYDITWLPIIYGQLLSPESLKTRTIYGILEQDYNIPVLAGCYRLLAENAETHIAQKLKVPTGTALFLINRVSYTLGNKPVYFQKRYYRNDKVIYEMRLERNEAGSSNNSGALPMKEFLPVFGEATKD